MTPAVLEMSGSLCTCGWIGAIVASSYFAYVALAGTSAWSNVFLSLAVAFVAKCLAVALKDYKNRAIYVEKGLAANDDAGISKASQRHAFNDLSPDTCADEFVATVPDLVVPDPITSNVDKHGWNDSAYQVGRTLGKHWATRDANTGQMNHLKNIGDGMKWVESHHKGVSGMANIFDPEKNNATDPDLDPSPSFLAGFIDGAQDPES